MPCTLGCSHSLVIIAVSMASTLFAELVSWIFVYRTEAYLDLKGRIDRSKKKSAAACRWAVFIAADACLAPACRLPAPPLCAFVTFDIACWGGRSR